MYFKYRIGIFKEKGNIMSKALFVIDMQEATMGKNHAKMFEYPTDLLKKINDVI